MTPTHGKWEANGVVEAVIGPAVGPASAISYAVRVNLPGAPSTLFTGVIPCGSRYPEDKIDTVAAPPGTPVGTMRFGDTILFNIPEQFWITECQ